MFRTKVTFRDLVVSDTSDDSVTIGSAEYNNMHNTYCCNRLT